MSVLMKPCDATSDQIDHIHASPPSPRHCCHPLTRPHCLASPHLAKARTKHEHHLHFDLAPTVAPSIQHSFPSNLNTEPSLITSPCEIVAGYHISILFPYLLLTLVRDGLALALEPAISDHITASALATQHINNTSAHSPHPLASASASIVTHSFVLSIFRHI